MKYIKSLIKFHLVRIYNSLVMDIVGKTHNKNGKCLLLSNEQNAKDIGWVAEKWDRHGNKLK